MKIEVQIFANLREIVGIRNIFIDLKENSTVADLLDILKEKLTNGTQFYNVVVNEKKNELQKYFKIIVEGKILMNDTALEYKIENTVKRILIFPPVAGG